MLVRDVSGPKIQGSDIDLEIWVSDFTYRLLEKVVRPVISGQKIRIAIGDFLEVFIVNGKNPDSITLAVLENQEKIRSWSPETLSLYIQKKRKLVGGLSGVSRKKAKESLAKEFGLNPIPWIN